MSGDINFTCYSCIHYRISQVSHAELCELGIKADFPLIGEKCAKFVYEPGSDELEREYE